VRFEDSMREAFVYIPGRSMEFFIPPANNRPNYSPKSFTGMIHYIEARYATAEEIKKKKNLALNVYDQHENNTFYPHASANVETRGEAVFAARNAVDGMYANSSHGKYPYQSWGINRDPAAALTIDFGREVLINEIRLTLRADYPHDNYWVSADINFDDGSSETLKLEKSEKPQCFKIKERKIKSLVLENSINGINAGLSAGARVIMVPDTIEPTDEIRKKVDAVEPDLEGVIEWISRENGGARL